MKGSALVGPNAVAALAGERGVLLLDPYPVADPYTERCEVPERNAGGTPASFYDARTHAITRVSGDIGLVGFGLASLADGRVMVAGGYDPKDASAKPTRRTRIWDPRSPGKWAEAAPMTVARNRPFLVTLADGRLMAVGGWGGADTEDCEGCTTATVTAELYDPATNRWTPTSEVNPESLGSFDFDPEGGVIALSGGQVLATGRYWAALYDPATGTWTAPASYHGWGPIALRDGTALSFGDKFFGAEARVAVPFTARFDPRGGTRIVGHWRPSEGAAIAVLADGRVTSVGGIVWDEDGVEILARAEVFDPDTGLLSEIASMPAGRGTSAAVPLADGSVLVVGGVGSWGEPDDEEDGNGATLCVPVKYRVMRWVP